VEAAENHIVARTSRPKDLPVGGVDSETKNVLY